VRVLDSGSGKYVVKWGLVCGPVEKKSPVEVQQAQETAELTGGLGSLAVLEMGYSFFQRLGTLGGHLVTKEGDLGCSEDDSLPHKSVEERP
jgi:hypothetical protein